MNALVLGGSVFIGRRLVEVLVEAGWDVAVLNRGRTPVVLPDGVERLVADRTDLDSMRTVLRGRSWEALFDVSGFVMAAGGSDIGGLVHLVAGSIGGLWAMFFALARLFFLLQGVDQLNGGEEA